MGWRVKTERGTGIGNSTVLLHISVMLFGLSAVLGQFVDAPAVIITGGRVICSSLVLLAISLVGKTDLRLRCKKDYGLVIFTGIVLAIHWTTFFQSIQSFSIAIGTITFSAFPLFLTFLEPVIFHEKLRLRSIISAVCGQSCRSRSPVYQCHRDENQPLPCL